MPCSCDGYDRLDAINATHALEHERKLRCRAQSLAHKLAKVLEEFGTPPSGELADAVRRERASLLEHKRSEHQRDVKKAEDAVVRIVTTIRQITKLGGIPTQTLHEEWGEAEKLVRVMSAITDAELLG